MADDSITTGILHPDGTFTDEKKLSRDSIRACPHYILLGEHYRANGICRCNDVNHSEMKEWGYVWDVTTKMWVAREDEAD